MSELHKPIGLEKDGKRRMPVGYVLSFLAIIGMVGATAFVALTSRDSDAPAVVAINNNQQPSQSADGDDETSDAASEEGELQPLTPLEPLEPLSPVDVPASGATEQPTFTPQVEPQRQARSKWLPHPDLVEPSEFGALPRISTGGVRPLDVYSQSSGTAGANRIAIVIGGFGLSQSGTQEAIQKLPAGITLAFSPLGNSLNRWGQTAIKDGHEIALQLPMEPLGYPSVDPGPRTLTMDGIGGENLRNLRWSLGRMTNYPVVMNYLGAGLSGQAEALKPILRELHGRGLAYLDDGTVRASIATDLAQDIRMPHASGNIVIDEARDRPSIRAQLEAVELLARNSGFAIATATAFPQTVDMIADWAEGAGKRGLLLVPLSTLIRDFPR
ncbi:MAG: divergent polysaccharide deacetylase family protein [Ahrensia sp.]|nr:divergent polysaccharide deacetylase family protein [Ahrensia sp.]